MSACNGSPATTYIDGYRLPKFSNGRSFLVVLPSAE
jgi:hypothetical protein